MRIRLVHWNAAEAEERAERLRALGHDVDARVPTGPATVRELRADPPDAVVVDLSRLPAQGRDFGIQMRLSPATRNARLVFVDGDEEKASRVRELLPDASFGAWTQIASLLKRRPPAAPVVPESAFAAHRGVPLATKLGVAGATIALVDPPDAFRLDDVTVRGRGGVDVVLWFATRRADVERRILTLADRARDGNVWVFWPKRTSGVETDLTQPVVRRIGLERGLVDYKVVSVDDVWTGLRFRRRAR